MQEEKIDNTENIELDNELLEQLRKAHTPWRRATIKVGRNDICPFCNSGKKFKKCDCYNKYRSLPKYTINYD